MNYNQLNDDNIVNFAMKNYDNPSCKNIEEFQEDFNRIKYIKRLFNRYQSSGILRERLILNHIITFYNVFGLNAATRMLFNKIDEKHYPLLKTFLTYLNYCPQEKFDGIDITGVPLEQKVVQVLRSLK
jgi:sulfur relay (sulfurtransferase) DsrC/TusE family protein|tara:strand:+ start:146 stop:529 length:384 start_codon:yes stop_codon:yes gene_type:complete